MKIPCARVIWFGFVLCLERLGGATPEKIDLFLQSNCMDCHDSETHKGGLNLDDLAYQPTQRGNAQTWEHIFDRVAHGEMPPKNKPQPEEEARTTFLAGLGKELRSVSLSRQAMEGRGPVRRLTRTEYEATVNDLLHIHTDLRSLFPEDTVTSGFDKVGEGLTLSAAHFVAYQSAAEKARNMAINGGGVIDMDEDGSALFARDEKTFTGWGSWLEGDTMVLTSRILYPNRSVYSVPAPRSGRYRVTITVQARNNGGRPLPVALGIHDVRVLKPTDSPDTSVWIDASETQPRTVTTEFELDARQQVHLFGPTLEAGLKVNRMSQAGERWSGRALLIKRFKVEGPLKPDGTLDPWPGLS